MRKYLIFLLLLLFAVQGHGQIWSGSQVQISQFGRLKKLNVKPTAPVTGFGNFYNLNDTLHYENNVRDWNLGKISNVDTLGYYLLKSDTVLLLATKFDLDTLSKVAGQTGHVQFNTAGKFDSDTSFYYDKSLKWLWVPEVVATNLVSDYLSAGRIDTDSINATSHINIAYRTAPKASTNFSGQLWVKSSDQRLRYTDDGGFTFEATIPGQSSADSLKFLQTNGTTADWVNPYDTLLSYVMRSDSTTVFVTPTQVSKSQNNFVQKNELGSAAMADVSQFVQPQMYIKVIASNGENNIPVVSPLQTTTKIFYNGTLIENTRWSGVGTDVLILSLDTRVYDTILITN
jgi:hypothetical protein